VTHLLAAGFALPGVPATLMICDADADIAHTMVYFSTARRVNPYPAASPAPAPLTSRCQNERSNSEAVAVVADLAHGDDVLRSRRIKRVNNQMT
jgi:hypothetical protein